MPFRWLIVGTVLYVLAVAVFVPVFGGVPYDFTFESDAKDYSRGAVNLLSQGFYSVDGENPFMEREPGMSLFLVPVFALFGVENVLALLIVQCLLFFICALFFGNEIREWYGARIAGLTFTLLLTSGSIIHSLFMGTREALSISLFLIATTLTLRALRRNRMIDWILIALPLSWLILTYFPILLLPLGIGVLFFSQARYRSGIFIFLLVLSIPIIGWGMRNASYDGQFRIIGNQRTAVMWYVRGEQAERVHGLEPLRCLYAEYVSRDWTGRSDACSFNGLMHAKWPNGFDRTKDYSDVALAGQEKIRANILSYLNFSFFEILELHIPFVGGGFSTTFNVFVAATGLLLYIGFFLGLPLFFRSKKWIWLVPIAYNVLVYTLTDATPRYLVPFLLFYALIAAFGYDRLLAWREKRS